MYECLCDDIQKPFANRHLVVVYCERIKRQLKRRELEHLKIETRLINERFVSVMGECVLNFL